MADVLTFPLPQGPAENDVAEGRALLEAFLAIRDRDARQLLIEMARKLAQANQGGAARPQAGPTKA
jgi:hypothetical protein